MFINCSYFIYQFDIFFHFMLILLFITLIIISFKSVYVRVNNKIFNKIFLITIPKRWTEICFTLPTNTSVNRTSLNVWSPPLTPTSWMWSVEAATKLLLSSHMLSLSSPAITARMCSLNPQAASVKLLTAVPSKLSTVDLNDLFNLLICAYFLHLYLTHNSETNN